MKELTIEQKAKAYGKVREKITLRFGSNVTEEIFSEFEMSEDEKIRKQILSFLKEFAHDHYRSLDFSSWIAWLEKQGEPIDEEKVLIGARKDVAMSIMNYLDDKSVGMCLSEMERKDIEDALINSKWNKLYNYMKKKLEKQGEQKPTLEDAAKLFLEALSETPYNNTPIVEAQIITKQLLTFLSDPKAYNPNAINEQKPTDMVEPKDYHAIDPNFCKPVDKVEPKFKVGYKIRRKTPSSCDKDMQVARIEKDYYICNHIGKFSSEVVPFSEESSYELVEQKPTDKVEPKFHEGEWIISKNKKSTYQVIEVKRGIYVIRDNADNHEYHIGIEECEKSGKLWNISDAKDGDVLVMQKTDITYESIFIFNKIENNRIIQYLHYFTTDAGEEVCEARSIGGFLGFAVGTTVHPATKEQRNALEMAMADAGYEWDAEKKELKKIDNEEVNGEDYGIDGLWHAQRILEKTLGSVEGYQTDDGILDHKAAITAVKKLYEHKPAEWSEEDKKCIRLSTDIIDSALRAGFCVQLDRDRCVDWFKSLKDRVQPKQEWGDEDEHRVKDTIYFLDTAKKHYASTVEIDACIDWLKSLRPQKPWKPSMDQLRCLLKYAEQNNYDGTILTSLYKDLKRICI